MKKKPYIINTSRSQCVESKSLIKAYKMKKIKGFYLDVFDKEPISSNSELYKTINDNIVLTPHAAGVSRDIPSKTAEIIAKEIKKILDQDAKSTLLENTVRSTEIEIQIWVTSYTKYVTLTNVYFH